MTVEQAPSRAVESVLGSGPMAAEMGAEAVRPLSVVEAKKLLRKWQRVKAEATGLTFPFKSPPNHIGYSLYMISPQ